MELKVREQSFMLPPPAFPLAVADLGVMKFFRPDLGGGGHGISRKSTRSWGGGEPSKNDRSLSLTIKRNTWH